MKNITRSRDYNYKELLILAIETSCDETAVAVTRGTEVLSNIVSSQIEIHRRFGGVVPEIASRNHILAIDSIIEQALKQANIAITDIEAIAVTYGAGLLGALLVGVSYAKGLSYALKIPLFGINHIKGHFLASFIENTDLGFPFICLLASGGHTAILKVKGYYDSVILGATVDDAAGEAFDKVARALGLPYPGGPEIEKHALQGKDAIQLPKIFKGKKHLNFSYSGLKTAVINYIHNSKARKEEINSYDIACSFQKEATSMLIEKAIRGAQQENINKIVLAGGVGANTALRDGLTRQGQEKGIRVFLPSKKLCTDNAAMIGVAAYFAINEGKPAESLDFDANAGLTV